MIIARKAWLLAGLILVSAGSSTGKAQDSFGLGYAYMYGYGATNLPYVQSYIPPPPYFSLHPPVYYGKRYKRPFGDSPFASWPQLQPASNYRPQPAVPAATIELPQSLPAACPTCQLPSSSRALARQTSEPVTIENPFFHGASDSQVVQRKGMDNTTVAAVGSVAP